MGVLNNPIQPAQQTSVFWGARSHWMQPWRGYQETPSAVSMLNALGVNSKATPARASAVAQLLAASGFKNARVEIPWGLISYDNESTITGLTDVQARLNALKVNGIRPLILLNSHHGQPCPMRQFTITTTTALTSSGTSVGVDAGTADRIRATPGKVGFNGGVVGAGFKAAAVIFTSVTGTTGQAGTATLSKPTGVAMAAGTYTGDQLKYAPFGPPYSTGTTPRAGFEETLTGWLNYVQVVLTMVKTLMGNENFDAELWNEMSFGSAFLDFASYYTTPPAGVGVGIDVIATRTAQHLATVGNGLTNVGLTTGFESQRPWGSAATTHAHFDAISKHPYHGTFSYPADNRTDGNHYVDALGQLDENVLGPDQNQPKFSPTYTARFPEVWLTGLIVENLIRDLSPITTNIGSTPHGRNSGTGGQEMWITEYQMTTLGQGTPPDDRNLQAKSALRFFVSHVGRGATKVQFYTDHDPGFGMIADPFIAAVDAGGGTYPGTAQGGITMDTFRRFSAAFTGATTPSTARQLTIDSVDDKGDERVIFTGDGTVAHPTFYNRDALAFFPFQVTNSKFVCAVYVMTRNMGASFGTDQSMRLTIGGINGLNATLSGTDPNTGATVTPTVVSRTNGSIVVDMPVNDGVRLLTLEDTGAAPPPNPPPVGTSVTWTPTNRQEIEADTLYLFDPAVERTLSAGVNGGWISAQADQNHSLWTTTSNVQEAGGRFRGGVRSSPASAPTLNPAYAWMWMPATGLINPAEFTIEFWVNSNAAWSTLVDQIPVALVSQDTGARTIRFTINSGVLTLLYANNQDQTPRSYSLTWANAGSSGTWVNIAATLNTAGDLKLYTDGTLRATQAGVVPIQNWGDSGRTTGLCMCGAIGKSATNLTVSDLRISRTARVPATPVTVTEASTLTVDPATTTGSTIRPALRGTLHTLAHRSTNVQQPQNTTMATNPRALNVIRTDKLLQTTPIKAGAPDATRPSAGVSGAYSYDWQVVDRSIDYIIALGMTPYISVDATPQILGGSVPPYSGSALTNNRASQSGFPNQIPNSNVEWNKIVRDLVHHCINEKGYTIPYWGVWNEPDGGSFWAGTMAQYFAMYEATYDAVKQVSAGLKVGGPEVEHFSQAWIEGLIDYGAANACVPDFISWHFYTGDVSEFKAANASINRWAAEAGVTISERINGEWCWQNANLFGVGLPPWRSFQWHLSDFHASWAAASMMEMQNTGHIYSVYTGAVARLGDTGYDSSGLMDHDLPWANLNVFRMWGRMGPTGITTTYSGQPGVFQMATKDTSGKVTILLAHHRYRKNRSPEIKIQLPSGNAGKAVTQYVIDDGHSNALDAGDSNAELQTVAAGPVASDNSFTITMRPRAVHLIEIGTVSAEPPPPPPPTGDSYVNTKLALANLHAYYRLNETSGTTASDSAGTKHATYESTASLALGQTGPLVGDATDCGVLFNNGGRVTLPSTVQVPIGSSLTVEWWQHVPSGQGGTAFNLGNSDNPNKCRVWMPHPPTGTIYWEYGDQFGGSGLVTHNYAGYYDKWTHCAVSYDSSTNLHAIYLDGALVASATSSVRPTSILTGGHIGSFPLLGGNFQGTISEPGIFLRALSLAEVQALRDAGLSGTTTDTTPPETTITSSPVTGTATSGTFVVSSNETGSTFEVRMDGGPWEQITGNSKSYAGQPPGTHTFEARATDAAGNVDLSPASATWTITAPPSSVFTDVETARVDVGDAFRVRVEHRETATGLARAFTERLEPKANTPAANRRDLQAKIEALRDLPDTASTADLIKALENLARWVIDDYDDSGV
jgi:hypothetical protein